MGNSFRETPADGLPMEAVARFDYAAIGVQIARTVRVSAERIRQLVKRSLDDIVEIGTELISVKQALPHGQFKPWLDSEFGWKERSARNFMNVAQRFKSASVADLTLDLTAAYLLAAPSTPERARSVAIKRAENGEHVTITTAEKIIAETKSKQGNGQAAQRRVHHAQRTLKALGRLKQQWPDGKAQELARLLREFADSLESSQLGSSDGTC
ncbi:MAG: DUF3102 domain-containing protein [Planctomycetes bacterium]|nr:DUF3102 domain-containing protein [Planctomycetota bacterium]